jgi:pyruvate formate lyase activating enzyme
MDVKGWVRTSLIDFSGHIATVVFTAGCNFRCPMCHNAELVLSPNALPTLAPDTLWTFLRKRVGQITGVVITGGEPTLQVDLPEFMAEVRGLGYAVKLDTNGYRPSVLRDLLEAGLVDYVAMDIKAPPEKYGVLTGIPDLDLSRIERSLALLRTVDIPCEFRTTLVPGLLDIEDVAAIARWLSADGVGAATQYVVQQFRGQETLDPNLAAVAPYASEVLRQAAERARDWLPDVSCRGI